MNIIVCVKQTPEAGKGEMDPGTGTVLRTGCKLVINPFDLYAMEAALRVQEQASDTRIIALSMGPESAASVLRDCIGLGAETGYLVCDPAFEGSDVRGTAQVLARAVRVIEKREGLHADAVFCGAKTVDGGTSMLGPELAQFLGISQVTYALHCSPEQAQEVLSEENSGKMNFGENPGTKNEGENSGKMNSGENPGTKNEGKALDRMDEKKTPERMDEKKIPDRMDEKKNPEEMCGKTDSQGIFLRVEKEDDRGNRIYSIPAPCLVTFTKASFQVRYPMIARILEAESMELPVLTAEDILAEVLPGDDQSNGDPVAAGHDGAAMQVHEVQLRKLDKQSQIIEDPDPVKAVTALAQRLFSEGIL